MATRQHHTGSAMLARLQAANLPHDELLRVVSKFCETNQENRRTVDALLSHHHPVPQWAVTAVLLSPDLIPDLFSSLESKYCAAACVCKAWRQGWVDTLQRRRGLRPGREVAGMLHTFYDCAESPNGDRVVFKMQGNYIKLMDSTRDGDEGWNCLHTFVGLSSQGHTMSDDALCFTVASPQQGVRRYETQPPFALVAEYELQQPHQQAHQEIELTFFCPLFGGAATVSDDHPGGLLYAICYPNEECYDDEVYQDEVYAFDALTLELCFRFGGGVFEAEAYGTAVVGSELYVGDRQGVALQVFSLLGQHLREVRGDWRQPKQILHVNGRLYMIEQYGSRELDGYDDDEDEWPQARHEAGRRILVLTPEGETLQVWKAPPKHTEVDDMEIFQNELLITLDSPRALLSLAGI